jgi:hypothetical protein
MLPNRRAFPRAFLLLVLLAAMVALSGRQTPARAANGGSAGTAVTVLYMSDTRGKIEPCG